jgi:C_GCAxxG_C_C family probable redox protein
MNDIDNAARHFEDGFACSQAVLAAYSGRFGLERDMALRLAEGFAGGMAGLGKTCGAVTGAILVLGLAHGRTRPDDAAAKMATADSVRKLVARFEAQHGSVACRDLLGCEIDTPEKLQAARNSGLFRKTCPGFVRSAAAILEQLLAG